MLWVGRQPFLVMSKAEDAKLLLDKVCSETHLSLY